MSLPITRLGSLGAATTATSPSGGTRSAASATNTTDAAPVSRLAGSGGGTGKGTLHVKSAEEPSLTRIHIVETFSRGALRDAFDYAVNAALSTFTVRDDDGTSESLLLSASDSGQFFSLDSKDEKQLLNDVQTALDDGRFDDAGDLLTDAMDLFNKGNVERFHDLAAKAGRAFEESLKYSLGHVRMNGAGDGDFTEMMNRAAEDGGRMVEEALGKSLFADGDALKALTRAGGDAVDLLLADDRRDAYTTSGRAALLKARAVSGSAEGDAQTDAQDPDLPEVTGDLLADVADYVKHQTLDDSETMASLRDVAGRMASSAEETLKDGIGAHSLRIEYDKYLEIPPRSGKAASELEALTEGLETQNATGTARGEDAGGGASAGSTDADDAAPRSTGPAAADIASLARYRTPYGYALSESPEAGETVAATAFTDPGDALRARLPGLLRDLRT